MSATTGPGVRIGPQVTRNSAALSGNRLKRWERGAAWQAPVLRGWALWHEVVSVKEAACKTQVLERLHLSYRGQPDRLVFGHLTMLYDIEYGVTAKPSAFANIAALALCPVVEPGSDQVRLRCRHVATLDAAKITVI